MFDQASVESVGSGGEHVPAWMRLHSEMQSATRRRCAWDAEHARHLREAEAMLLWNHFGCISILDYLEREHGIDPRTAKDRLRVSQALAELPLLEAELEDGTFQYSHVKELTRVVTPETEEEWIAAAKGKTCGDVQTMVSGRKKGDGPDDPDHPDLRLRWFSIELPPQTIAVYRELWAEIEKEMGHRIEEAEFFRIMLERARVSPEGTSTPAQISICSHCERGWQSGPGGRAEVEPSEIERALCDAEHLGSVNGEPQRKTVRLTPKKRARIMARDNRRCTVPGCRSKRNLDAHHIVHQEDGGGHEDWNITTLCWGHHVMHHRGRLAIEGRAPDKLSFVFRRADDDAHVGTNERHAHVGTNENHAYVGTNVSQRNGASGAMKLALAAMRAQARDALVGLGWKISIAGAAVEEACTHVGSDATIDVLIREALRRCPRPLG